MLEARSLTKSYSSVPALENVSFRTGPGEVLGYLGPNGSGKSTTVKILTGLLEPTSGSVFFNGRNIKDDLAGYKRLVGYVPEEANLYPFLSGLEYLQLVGRLRGPDRDAVLEARMHDLAAPTLVLFGTLDRLMPPEMGRHYKTILPNCHLVFFYDAGHEISTDRPEAFADVTDDFLQRHEAFVISRADTLIHP